MVIDFAFRLLICNSELRSKILLLEKTQKSFGFLLAYSYLCPLKVKKV